MGEWVLLRVNRWAIAGVILLVVFAVLVGLSYAELASLRTIVENQNGLGFLVSDFIGTIVTGTAIVITINQLVLSQELGAFGDQRKRMKQSMEFRRDIESKITQDTSAAEPAAFLSQLADGIQAYTATLEAAIEGESDGKRCKDIREYIDGLDSDTRELEADLEGTEFGTFAVIWSALKFDYSRKIHRGREIRAEYAHVLSDEANDALDEIIELLTFFGPIREHFKTLYFQWELINLSRALVYTAVPALTTMRILMMHVDGTTLPGSLFGVDRLVWLTSAGFVVGISPFVVFIAYILRIATVAKLTLAIGPFILEETDHSNGPDE